MTSRAPDAAVAAAVATQHVNQRNPDGHYGDFNPSFSRLHAKPWHEGAQTSTQYLGGAAFGDERGRGATSNTTPGSKFAEVQPKLGGVPETTATGQMPAQDNWKWNPAVSNGAGAGHNPMISSGSNSHETVRSNSHAEELDILQLPSQPPPLPSRFAEHLQSPLQPRTRSPKRSSSGVNWPPSDPDDSRTPPIDAPLLYSEGRADFFPWTGNHPEDVLSEHNVKQGYFDKSQAPQNEHQSARTLLWPALRHRAGLQMLSSLYASVFEQRQAQGRLSAASSFKPPPRVTLNDTKREVWLKDLANSSVPLRRLSRTIPHGIRGKGLLDQCLSKKIPTNRAIWLVKCVGVNELRAAKRKGTGAGVAQANESKWIRDWTVFVEQFVEEIVNNVGQADWRAKMDYTIRLAAHLFSEHLLDLDHYLKWVLSSFENASFESIPIWTLNLRVYWRTLARSRKLGRRLAEILISKVELVSSVENGGMLEPVAAELRSLTQAFAAYKPSNFIHPSFWKQHAASVFTLHPDLAASNKEVARQLEDRNQRLTAPLVEDDEATAQQERLARILNTSIRPNGHRTAAREILQSITPTVQNVALLLRWAAMRPATVGRVYFAVRILRMYRKVLHLDVTEVILSALDFLESRKSSSDQVFFLISELVRSKDFSVAKYLQNLIASGRLDRRDSTSNRSLKSILLPEILLEDLPQRTANLAYTLMRKIQISSGEANQTLRIKGMIKTLIPDLFQKSQDEEDLMMIDEEPSIIRQLRRKQKAEVGRWLRNHVHDKFRRGKRDNDPNTDPSNDQNEEPLDYGQFSVLRALLEELEDFSMLADTLKLVASSSDPVILASIADTVHYHRENFTAIGALEDLSVLLLKRYQLFPMSKSVDNCFTSSLCSLAQTTSTLSHVGLQLAAKLQQDSTQAAVLASSPISEHTVEMAQSTDQSFSDEMEAQLASGNAIDRETFQRFFDAIASRLESSWADAKLKPLSYALLLYRLRLLDYQSFIPSVKTWIRRICGLSERPHLGRFWKPLALSGCLKTEQVFGLILEIIQSDEELDHSSKRKICYEMLESLSEEANIPQLPLTFDDYRFRLLQAEQKRMQPLATLQFLTMTLEIGNAEETEDMMRLLNRTGILTSFWHQVVGSDVDLLSIVTGSNGSSSQSKLNSIQMIFDELIKMDGSESTANGPWQERLLDLVKEVDSLTISFSKMRLRLLLLREQSGTSSENPFSVSEVASIVFDSIHPMKEKPGNAWLSLIASLGVNFAHELCQKAEKQLLGSFFEKADLALVPKFPVSELTIRNSPLGQHILIIEAAISTNAEELSAAYSDHLVPALENIVQLLSPEKNKDLPDGNLEALRRRNNIVELKLPILLRLLVIHKPAFTQESGNLSQDLNRILICLCAVLAYEEYYSAFAPLPAESLQTTFDLAAWYFDDSPAESLRAVEEHLFALFTPLIRPTPNSPAHSRTPSQSQNSSSQANQSLQHGMTSHQPSKLTSQLPERLQYLLSIMPHPHLSDDNYLPLVLSQKTIPTRNQQHQGKTHQRTASTSSTTSPTPHSNKKSVQTSRTTVSRSIYPIRHWEMIPDPTPLVGENDTCLDLTLFGARRA